MVKAVDALCKAFGTIKECVKELGLRLTVILTSGLGKGSPSIFVVRIKQRCYQKLEVSFRSYSRRHLPAQERSSCQAFGPICLLCFYRRNGGSSSPAVRLQTSNSALAVTKPTPNLSNITNIVRAI